MTNQSKPICISCFLIFVIVYSRSISVAAQEDGHEREFDYVEGGNKGPGHWGDLKKEWSACKIGTTQSPIDISNERVKVVSESGVLRKNYKPCKATLQNRGHDISVKNKHLPNTFYNLKVTWSSQQAGSVEVNGTNYVLDRVHWHTPSEHAINGRRYDMELHMVHTSTRPNVKNDLAVIGLLYNIGPPDPFLSKLVNNITSIADRVQQIDVGIINPNDIKMGGSECYRYKGSLTTPPCTEGVIWTINKEIGTVSEDQIKVLQNAVYNYAEMNARPLQSINDRKIELYSPNPTQN